MYKRVNVCFFGLFFWFFSIDDRFRKSVISLPLHRPLYPYIRISV